MVAINCGTTFKYIAYDTIIRHLENRSFGVIVDGNNNIR